MTLIAQGLYNEVIEALFLTFFSNLSKFPMIKWEEKFIILLL